MHLSINALAPPGTKIESKLSPLEIFGISAMIVIIIAILIAICYCCYKKHKRDKEKANEAPKYKSVNQD